MEEKLLPTRYYLEICENSLANDPTIVFESSTPIGTFKLRYLVNTKILQV